MDTHALTGLHLIARGDAVSLFRGPQVADVHQPTVPCLHSNAASAPRRNSQVAFGTSIESSTMAAVAGVSTVAAVSRSARARRLRRSQLRWSIAARSCRAATARRFKSEAEVDTVVESTTMTKAQNGSFSQEFMEFAPPLAVFLASDKVLKDVLVAQGVTFPSPLVGLFLIFVSLMALDVVDSRSCQRVVSFFDPACGFIQRWLPVFYVAPLVTLPLAVQSLQVAEIAKLLLIVAPGFALSLWFTGSAVTTIRNITNTELLPYEVKPPLPPFSRSVLLGWSSIAVAGLSLLATSPQLLLGSLATTAAPALVAFTIVGLIVGSELPAEFRKVVHPIITCALFGQLGVAACSAVTGTSFMDALKLFSTKALFVAPGAGDILMAFLGSVILSFAFSMFKQRNLIQRHKSEIFGGVLLSALFSMFSTAIAGRIIGLGPALTLTVVPRCITVALAMPTAQLLGVADTSITAAAVVLTGLIGANFVQSLLDSFGYKDPIVRGISTAASSHGLGTAALAAKEPEALSFCAIAYALTGIASSVLVAVPFIRDLVLAAAGAV